MLRLFERKTWVSAVIAAALIVLAVAVSLNLKGRVPALKPITPTNSLAIRLSAQNEEQTWKALNSIIGMELPTNSINPFHTLYFQPPPPPPTRKVSLQYQGCMFSSKGLGHAYVRVDNTLLILTNGAKVVGDHAISEIGVTTLTLTNSAGVTNVLKFRTKTVLEVPAS
ncbi:MAG: hypothetical protein N3G20_00955 [Verrucomicrobiae bacterium]|nr:hypothetical protein [Verrucomicrobiae bacterium]